MKLRKTRVPQQGSVSKQLPLSYETLCQTTSNHPELIHPLKQTSTGKPSLPFLHSHSSEKITHTTVCKKKLKPLNPNTL